MSEENNKQPNESKDISPNFINSDYFDPKDGEYTKNYDIDTLYTKLFKKNEGKYFSVVSAYDDGKPKEIEAIFSPTRYKLRLTFINKHKEVEEVRITKYKYTRKKEWKVEDTEGVRLDWLSFDKIIGFLKFLSGLDLPSINERKIKFAEDTTDFGDETVKKIKTLFSTEKGKRLIDELNKEGYLTSDLDIPELIKSGLSKTKIEEKRRRIMEFKKIISDPAVKEVSDIQRFLKNNPWLFGPEYKTLDFREAGFSGNPDGRLFRIDGLSDILEVKLPNEELLRADKKERQFISPKLAEALGQLTGYMEYYYSEYTSERDDATGREILKDTYGKYYKPKGILLIGRRGKESINAMSQTISAEPKNMRILLSYFHWVEVLTYDDLIERAENGLNNLIG
jgi:hypothetical protein